MISSVIISNGIRRIVIKEKGVSLDLPADVPYKVRQAGGNYHFLLGLEPIEPVKQLRDQPEFAQSEEAQPEMVTDQREEAQPEVVTDQIEVAQPETDSVQPDQAEECLAKPKYSKRLTQKQKEEVLKLIAAKMSQKAVAGHLGITMAQVRHTVKKAKG